MGEALTISIILAACLGWAGWSARQSVWRQSTLVGPALWLAAAIVAVAVWPLVATETSDDSDAIGRLMVGGLFMTPTIALLGAKRPQNKAWQWIVLSAWGVLVLPAAEAWLYRREVDVGVVRSWFMAILIALGLFNHVFTRYWPAAVGMSVIQSLTLSPFLPIPFMCAGEAWVRCAAVVLIVATFAVRRGRSYGTGLERVWFDFRDGFGAVWALRVVQRFQVSAEQNQWSVRLGWYGCETATGERGHLVRLSPTEPAARELRSLLLRFVSPAWLAQRWPELAAQR